MTIEAVDQSANPWAVEMPEPLAATVFRYDKATRLTIIENWDAIGAGTRQEYREYVAGARLSRKRQRRVRELILRLITGSDLRPSSAA
ncbi:MAG TPA: hypothetical protein VHZ96_17435 [Frankiaceae bacterium]|nr:hypothetical protein [Frankiaceae bacterium]